MQHAQPTRIAEARIFRNGSMVARAVLAVSARGVVDLAGVGAQNGDQVMLSYDYKQGRKSKGGAQWMREKLPPHRR